MNKKKAYHAVILIFPVLTGAAIVIPLVSVFLHSLDGSAAGSASGLYKILYLPFPVSFKQYGRALIGDRETLYYFWNSVKITIPVLVFHGAISLSGGYALAKFQFPCKRLLFFCYVLVMLLPVQVGIVGTYIFFDKIGLTDSHMGVILPGIFSSFGTFLMYQFLRTVPDSTLEEARLEGAGEMTVFLRIVLPQVKAGIASMVILVLIDTWNMVEMPTLLLRRQALQPMSVLLRYSVIGESDTVFASVMIFTVPMLLAFTLFQDSLSEGIAYSVPVKK